MLDKGTNLRLQIARQIVVLQQDAVLERLMPVLDLALGLWMAGRTPNVRHAPALQLFGQIACDVARSVVSEQPRAVHDRDLIEPGGRQRPVERLGDITGLHGGAQLPSDDVIPRPGDKNR